MELLSQHGTQQAELGGYVPAGLELAAARSAVTFALLFHVVGHDLCKQ